MGEALAFPKLCQTLHSPGVAFPRPPTTGFFRNRACVWRGLLRGLGARERCSSRTLSFPPAQPRKPRSGFKKGAAHWGVGRVTRFTRCGGRVRGRVGPEGSKRRWQAVQGFCSWGLLPRKTRLGKERSPQQGAPEPG